MIHPRSRKAKQLERILLREQTLQSRSAKTKFCSQLERLKWFQDRIHKGNLLAASMETLVEIVRAEYLPRLSTRLAQENANTTKYDAITFLMKQEQSEFENGNLAVPDLTDPETLSALRRWNGDISAANCIKTVSLVQPIVNP